MDRPIQHHYLPSFYLAGFTYSGDAQGVLHVLDQVRLAEWVSSPEKTARQRDYYAVELGPGEDPNTIERILSHLESEFSRVIRTVAVEGRIPLGDDFDWFLNFIALMIVRIPRTRELFTRFTDRFSKDELRKLLEMPEGWQQFKDVLEAEGKHVRDDEREEYRRFAASEEYTVDLDQTSHVQMMVKMIDPLLPALAARNWGLGIAAERVPDLICSDVPVSVWPTTSADVSQPITLESPHTVLTFPITRRLIAIGRYERQSPLVGVHPAGVALFNSRTLLEARQLFASSPDFTYLAADRTIKRKTDLLETIRNRQGAYRTLKQDVAAWFSARAAK